MRWQVKPHNALGLDTMYNFTFIGATKNLNVLSQGIIILLDDAPKIDA